MAHLRKKPDWQNSADAVATAAFEGLELAIKTGMKGTPASMPLLEDQRAFVMAALVSTARATMRWMAQIHREGADIAPAETDDL